MKDYPPCRYNVYWPRGAVGLHMRAENKDFAYFRPTCRTNVECPHKYVMAAALKGAEILASRLSFSLFLILVYDTWYSMHGMYIILYIYSETSQNLTHLFSSL